MKLATFCILPLLFILLSAQTNQSSSEQNYDLERLTESIVEIFPRDDNAQCQMKTVNWKEEKKNKAARNVFQTLLKVLKNPSRFSFEKLLVGMKCNGTGEEKAILYMKVKQNVTCKKSFFKSGCDEKNQTSVYCSWIGVLENELHKKMIGAVCYVSKTMSPEEEMELATLDLCSEWRYANTRFHRLGIPHQEFSWKTDFPLYYPPATDLEYHLILDEMGPEFSSMYVNQARRTGLVGRGIWKTLGENRMDIPILLRRYNGTRQILIANGHDKGQLKGPLAMFYRKPKNSKLLSTWNETDANDYFYSMVKPGNRKNCSMSKFMKDMKGKRKISNSYLSHPYETDNAWVKARVYMLVVSEKSCLYDLDVHASSNYLHYEWKSYNDSTLHTAKNVVNSMFNKEESTTIIAGNYLSAYKYLFYFLTAAIVMSIAFAASISFAAVALPLALLALAAAIGFTYQRRWIHVRDYIMC